MSDPGEHCLEARGVKCSYRGECGDSPPCGGMLRRQPADDNFLGSMTYAFGYMCESCQRKHRLVTARIVAPTPRPSEPPRALPKEADLHASELLASALRLAKRLIGITP